jgi:signal peptidase I
MPVLLAPARELLRATALAYLVAVGVLLTAALLPYVLGWRTTVVVSGSMEPAVHVGDVILFDHEAAATLKPGRIILFDDPNRPGQLISHRLYGWRPDGTLITKGDANPKPDSASVRTSHLRGAARMVIPRVGLLTVWLDRGTVNGRLWLAVTALAGCVVVAFPLGRPYPAAGAFPGGRHRRRRSSDRHAHRRQD